MISRTSFLKFFAGMLVGVCIQASAAISTATGTGTDDSTVTFSDVQVAADGEISFVASNSTHALNVQVNPATQSPQEIRVALAQVDQFFAEATTGVIHTDLLSPEQKATGTPAAPKAKSKTMCLVFGSVAGATVVASFYFLISRALSARLGKWDAFFLADGVIVAGGIGFFGCRYGDSLF